LGPIGANIWRNSVMAAFIDGREVSLQAAAAEAARLLAAARMPIVAGLGTDIAGARAALELAVRIGAAVDHMHAGALMRNLDVMREAGMMVTTPSEARLRADLFLLVGQSLAAAPQMRERLLPSADRRIVWLCPPRKTGHLLGTHKLTSLGRSLAELPRLLALLRARLAGHPVAITGRPLAAIDSAVAELKSARFGVAVWSADELDALSIEMLCTLVDDLNAGTRFTGLPLLPADNGRGVIEACGWGTGYPVRTGFGRGWPDHDPWRFDATRLVDSGECDCAVWISAYGAVVPDWRHDVPMVALTVPGTRFHSPPRVVVEVGTPGVDHDAIAFNPLSGTLFPFAAAQPRESLTVAGGIAAVLASLPESLSC
jgi:formylmethanofuran dehydrogenase subunit B